MPARQVLPLERECASEQTSAGTRRSLDDWRPLPRAGERKATHGHDRSRTPQHRRPSLPRRRRPWIPAAQTGVVTRDGILEASTWRYIRLASNEGTIVGTAILAEAHVMEMPALALISVR